METKRSASYSWLVGETLQRYDPLIKLEECLRLVEMSLDAWSRSPMCMMTVMEKICANDRGIAVYGHDGMDGAGLGGMAH